jgi:hypothetical protein
MSKMIKDAWTGIFDSMADSTAVYTTKPGYYGVTTTDNTEDPWVFASDTTISANDVILKGTSLGERLEVIEERLSILRPDLPLHKDWAELKDLYEQYNTKLEEIREKVKMWETLSK